MGDDFDNGLDEVQIGSGRTVKNIQSPGKPIQSARRGHPRVVRQKCAISAHKADWRKRASGIPDLGVWAQAAWPDTFQYKRPANTQRGLRERLESSASRS